MHLTFDQVNKFFLFWRLIVNKNAPRVEFSLSIENSAKNIEINELGWRWKNLIVQTGTFFHRGIVNRWKSINESVTMKIVPAMILISKIVQVEKE